MPRILLDENVPIGLTRRLGEDARHVLQLGWSRVSNGLLLTSAEQAGFEILITADSNLRFQQNLLGRRLGVIVLSTNNWAQVRRSIDPIIAALDAIQIGEVILVDIRGSRT